MGLTMREKKSVSKEYAKRYQRSNKVKKGELLKEFTRLTGYRRDYASYLLRNWGKRVYLRGSSVILVGDFKKRRKGSGRKHKYGSDVLDILLKFWELLNYACGKRLKPELEDLLTKSEQFNELTIPKDISDKLREISPASIDRLLKPVRKKYELKPRAKTKPGTLLKKDIPIRTGTANHDANPHPESYENIIRVCLCSSVAKKLIFMVEWNEDEVGFLEIDLVSHDGGNTRGDFSQTLNCVDIKSYWVDFATVKNKAQTWAASISAGLRLSI